MCCVGWCVRCSVFYFFFFFKQKTAYEMRISDWSSDVCSSDLFVAPPAGEAWAVGARVAFVDEAAGDRAGPGIHVLVVAPHGEIGSAVVQLHRQVAGGVRAVAADQRAGGMAQARDLAQVEGLAAAVLHARPYDQRSEEHKSELQ